MLRSTMQTEQIVALLITERNRLDATIQALQGAAKRRGRQPEASPTPSAPAAVPVASLQ